MLGLQKSTAKSQEPKSQPTSEPLMQRTMLTAVDFKFAGPGGGTNSAIFIPNKISTITGCGGGGVEDPESQHAD